MTDEKMRITSAGNVGIGVTVPASKLTINNIVSDRNSYDHSESPLTITHQTASSSTVLNDPKTILHLCRQGTGGQAFGGKASFKLCRWENNGVNSRTRLDITLAHGQYDDTNIICFESDGTVGIGTLTPQRSLHVQQALRIGGSGAVIDFGDDMTTQIYRSGTSQEIRFVTGNVDNRMIISSGGNVSIGTTDTATYKLNVNGSLNATSLFVGGTAFTGSSQWVGTTNIYNITGNVGIGTNNPLAKLHINYTSTATNPDTGITGLYVYNPTNTAGQNSVITNRIGGSTAGSVIYGFDVSGSYGYSIKMNGNSSALRFNSGWNGAGTDRLVLGTEGTLYTTNDVWHSSIEGSQRIYYAASSTTYLRGHGGTPFVFRNGGDGDIAYITSGGNLNITGSYLINGVAHNHDGTYLKYQSIDGRLGTALHNWGYNYTYLGFGAGAWHTQNYAYIRTIQAAGDVGTFVLQTVCSSAWINMYYSGGLAMNTNWTLGSDLRIKFDINKIEDDECLSIIRNINMYKYKLKEARQQKRYGNYMNYGFIAQDILKYLPQAVSSRRNVIPSIHKPCTIIGDILELDDINDYVDKFNNVFKFEYEPKINDVLELLIYEDFSNNEKIKLQIIEIFTNKKYRIINVEGVIDYNKKYFVYGNIVDDNLSLEHSMIHNVGIGAIKCIDNEVTQLKDEIILLKNENTLLKDEIILLKEKLNLLSNYVGFGNII
jgi:hypothetical protein